MKRVFSVIGLTILALAAAGALFAHDDTKGQKKVAKFAGLRPQVIGDLKGDRLEIEKIRLMP